MSIYHNEIIDGTPVLPSETEDSEKIKEIVTKMKKEISSICS